MKINNELIKNNFITSTNQITLGEKIKISYGSVTHTFTGAGTATKDIDITSLGYTQVYAVQITNRLTYLDTNYMKDSKCYLHSYTTAQLKVNLVNTYPNMIGYFIDYLIIGI